MRYLILACLLSLTAHAALPHRLYRHGERLLRLEFPDDHTVHFELTAHPSKIPPGPIAASALVARTAFPGARFLHEENGELVTASLRVAVDPGTLCFQLATTGRPHQRLTTICPQRLEEDWKGLTLTRENTRNLYGLGQQFRTPGVADGDWLGSVRTPGEINGNHMVHFNGGDNGNTQVPVLYAAAEHGRDYALFLDNTYRQVWDFRATPWKVDMWGDVIRGYVFVDETLAAVRARYLDLVGRPPVPPRKAFGLWVSEYGYRDWAEAEGKLATLRRNHFPVDGFMLDLFWFGGIRSDSDQSAMGRVAWDLTHFPDPRQRLADLRRRGIGVIPIEESYVARGLAEHGDLARRGFLVKDPHGAPAYLTRNAWWGRGGMIDWTNPAAGAYWHAAKRLPLWQDGVLGFWTDLGEPEVYADDGRYHEGREADVHNLYNFRWLESSYRGLARDLPAKRPFFLTRSGNAGIQRFGAAMWSGDIGSDLANLAAHCNAQMHLSFSGVDYYGSDLGGFHRGALKGDLNDVYTRWFAAGTLFDVPVRPHTENLCRCKETAPDRLGDRASNLANLRLRYALVPYLYSLAHRAHDTGEAVFPPLALAFESDPGARERAAEKMIGPWLLAKPSLRPGERALDVYLPRGEWVDFHDDRVFVSRGETVRGVSLTRRGLLRPPVFARAGALVPLAPVSEATLGTESVAGGPLTLRVYPSAERSTFALVEDDGETTAYLAGQRRRTELSQELSGDTARVTIGAARGEYAGALPAREWTIELVTGARRVTAVRVDGATFADWSQEPGRRLTVRLGSRPVAREIRVEADLAPAR